MSAYKLGSRSNSELQGVHDDLAAVVRRAIEITTQDFSVHDGKRTEDEQKQLVDKGASQTMESRHLTGHAVDLVPYVGGRLRWEWGPIFEIATAVRQAARERGVPIRWGAAWDVLLTDSDDPPEAISEGYASRRRAAGRKPFLDGPHFELPADRYPA